MTKPLSELSRIELVDEVVKLQQRNAELAAHVERLKDAGAELVDLMDGVREGVYKPDSFTNQPMNVAIAETPVASLARLRDERAMEIQRAVMAARHTWAKEDKEALRKRDARMKAEGAAELAHRLRYDYEGEIHQDRIADFADDVAVELRRQAEGEEP